jgi:hypothetical protein
MPFNLDGFPPRFTQPRPRVVDPLQCVTEATVIATGKNISEYHT